MTGADVPDAEAACDLLQWRLWDELPRREVVYADTPYRAGCLQEEVFDFAPFRLPVVSRPGDAVGFVRLPQRWVAEQTLAWLGRSRRLSKDCERLPASSEAMIQVSRILLMLRRLAPTKQRRSQRFRYAA